MRPSGAPEDPRDAIERTRRVAEGADAPAREAPPRAEWSRSPGGARPLLTEDQGVIRDIRAEALAAADARGGLTVQEKTVQDAWSTRRLVERVIEERKDRDDKESQRILADMRDRLKWLDENFGEDFEELKKARDGGGGVLGALGDVGGHSGTALAFLRNPAQGVMSVLARMFSGGAAGPIGLAATITATIATAVVPEVVRTLAQKGWPLNRDWRRSVHDEFNAAFDLRQQEDRLAGRDVYIYSQAGAYGSVAGDADTVSTLYRSDELRASMRTQAEQAIGGFY